MPTIAKLSLSVSHHAPRVYRSSLSEMPSRERQEEEEEEAGPSTKRLRALEHNNNSIKGGSTDFNSAELVVNGSCFKKCGILERITVKNFMCHEHLNFEFSPHINFVQGRNGSGKSAILTALVIGLGGGTRLTNRGKNIGELVKNGKQVAVIEIALLNNGKDAFKPEVYGRTIIVERRIVVTGGGGYKIKSWNGGVVSTKKEELVRLLLHFNLQVDNPVTILNQDMSRSFLNTTDPKMLYKFFLKATQLQQMKDDYASLGNSIQSSMKIIETRKKFLPDLEKEVEEQQSHYEFSVSLREKTKKLRDLRHELAWANIIHKEKDKDKAEKALENHKAARIEIKEKISSLEETVQQEKELKHQAKEYFNEATTHLMAVAKEVKDLEKRMKSIKDEYKDNQGQYNIAEKQVKSTKGEISSLRAAIEKDHSSAQKQWAEARADWQKKMDEVQDQIKEVVENVKTESTHCQNLQHTLEVKMAHKTQLLVEEKAARRKLNGLEGELKGLQSQQGSQLTVYGQWVPQLLKKIDSAHSKRWFTKKPVGPLGAFIEVKDNEWAHVAESVLGGRITSFCVDNQRDEKTLRSLMKEVKFDHQAMPIVTVAKFREKVHDVSRFEVRSPDYPSLWSILSISNTVVANTVIDQLQVESILLIPTSKEAGRLLKDKETVPKNCKCAYTLNLDLYYPDPNYRLYSGKGCRRAKFLQVSVEDKIREITRNKEDCKETLDSLIKQTRDSQNEIKKLHEEISASNKKSQQHKRKMDALRRTVADLQNQESPPPPDLSQLEDDVMQLEERLQNSQKDMDRVYKAMLDSKNKFDDLSGHLKELKQKEKEAYKEADKYKRALDQAKADTVLATIRAYNKKDQELQKKENDLHKAVKTAAESLEASMKIADNFNIGPRIETKKNVEELERQYRSLEARVNKERASSGNPVAVAERYKATKLRYKQVSEDVERHTNLLKKLKESLSNRERKYLRLYKWLAVIVKFYFREHLSVRKLSGSVNISIENQILTIHVEKSGNSQDLVRKEKKSKNKSAALQQLTMMSGGERSFSTVSLIIALWQAIDSPVRVLDEFDVFMDVIARNRAMKMMISSAKPETQYIFLTPLNLDTSKLTNCVIFRMPDPERRGEGGVSQEQDQEGQMGTG